ncbi:MAG: 50S ribosomal protein L30 [Bacteroidales bacterium]|nr:50S ribosomal protein L30 [Bacteroidales bacterium]
MAKIKITQVRSDIGSPKRQKLTLEALGLRKINKSVEIEATPQVLGMVTAVRHLVKVDQL